MAKSGLSPGCVVLRGLVLLLLTGVVTWAAAALWFDGPATRGLAGLLAAGCVIGSVAPFWLIKPFHRATLAAFVPFLVVLVWWRSIPPSNDRDWRPQVAQQPAATFDGNTVTLRNVRNFEHHTAKDFTEHWETRTYDLDRVTGFDLFISYWGPTLYAHTIASWEFADGRHLAVSIEARKRKGQDYSVVRSLFRQSELYYVVADERDVIGVRARFGERVYLYRLKLEPGEPRALLLAYLQEVNRLARQPKWYNALTDNCTTSIRYHRKHIGTSRQLNWKILLNGYLDELIYERGGVDTRLPFAELRRRSEITGKAKAAGADPAFSRIIREELPKP